MGQLAGEYFGVLADPILIKLELPPNPGSLNNRAAQ